MMDVYYYALLALGAFIATVVGTRGAIVALRARTPGLSASRRQSRAGPRGGIALVMALMVFLTLANANYLLIFALLMLAAVSLAHDWIALAPLVRGAAQLIAVLPLVGGVAAEYAGDTLFFPICAAIAVVWVISIQLYAQTDAMDGIAATCAIGMCMGLLTISALTGGFGTPSSVMALIVLSAVAGFLWWNFPPAKISLGEAGAAPLGLVLGYMLLHDAAADYGWTALILSAYVFCDVPATLWLRSVRRQKQQPYFFQRAARMRPAEIVVRDIIGMHMLLILLATLAALDPALGWMYAAVAYGMVIAVLLFRFRV